MEIQPTPPRSRWDPDTPDADVDGASPALPDPSCLIRREPVLGENQNLVAYRMRFVPTDDQDESRDPGQALIQAIEQTGAKMLFAHLPHWIDSTPALLQSTSVLRLPPQRVYIELPHEIEPTDEWVKTLQPLAHVGLHFALRGDLAAQPGKAAFLPFCKLVAFDAQHSSKPDIFRQSLVHKQAHRILLGVNAPDVAATDQLKMLGFSWFQNCARAKPNTDAPLDARQKTLMRLLALIMSEGSIDDIQASLQSAPDLVQALLDQVNTAAFGLSQEVTSLGQAIMLLGRRQLQRWIQVLVYSETDRPVGHLSAPLVLATARAHFLEALSNHRHPEQTVRADSAFTTGILSSIDSLFHTPIKGLLDELQIDPAMREALLEHRGPLGQELRLAELVFPADGDDAPPADAAALLAELNCTAAELAPIVQDAHSWAHQITHAAQ